MADRHPTPQQIVAPHLGLIIHSFGEVAAFLEDMRGSSDSAATAIMNDPALAKDFTERIIPLIFKETRTFWVAHEQQMLEAVRRLPGMKATFGGDLGPQRYFRHLSAAACTSTRFSCRTRS